MSELQKQQRICNEHLSGEFFLQSLIQEAFQEGMLTDTEWQSIGIQMTAILARLTQEFTGDESSSVSLAAAESLMQSAAFTIGLALKSLPSPDDAVEMLKTERLDSLFLKGQKLIKLKLSSAKQLYSLLLKHKTETANSIYNDTVVGGISGFFKVYDARFAAQEIIITADYPTFLPVCDLCGIEFIQQFLCNLYYEAIFCEKFTPAVLHAVLLGMDDGYPELIFNLFEQVLLNALGAVLAPSDVFSLAPAAQEVANLQNKLAKLSQEDTLKLTESAVLALLTMLDIDNQRLKEYIETGLSSLAVRMETAAKNGSLHTLLAVPQKDMKQPVIHYQSGEKMDDEAYRELIYTLSECRYFSDKLAMIKREIKSLSDMEDLLMDYEFNKSEMLALLHTLPDVELSWMLKRHPYQNGVSAVEFTEGEKILQLNLQEYLSKVPSDRQNRIVKLMNTIQED